MNNNNQLEQINQTETVELKGLISNLNKLEELTNKNALSDKISEIKEGKKALTSKLEDKYTEIALENEINDFEINKIEQIKEELAKDDEYYRLLIDSAHNSIREFEMHYEQKLEPKTAEDINKVMYLTNKLQNKINTLFNQNKTHFHILKDFEELLKRSSYDQLYGQALIDLQDYTINCIHNSIADETARNGLLVSINERYKVLIQELLPKDYTTLLMIKDEVSKHTELNSKRSFENLIKINRDNSGGFKSKVLGEGHKRFKNHKLGIAAKDS